MIEEKEPTHYREKGSSIVKGIIKIFSWIYENIIKRLLGYLWQFIKEMTR